MVRNNFCAKNDGAVMGKEKFIVLLNFKVLTWTFERNVQIFYNMYAIYIAIKRKIIIWVQTVRNM